MSDIPTGDTMEVVLDRMTRAGNFASSGAYMGEHCGFTPDQIGAHIRAARAMLDEAQRALDAVTA